MPARCPRRHARAVPTSSCPRGAHVVMPAWCPRRHARAVPASSCPRGAHVVMPAWCPRRHARVVPTSSCPRGAHVVMPAEAGIHDCPSRAQRVVDRGPSPAMTGNAVPISRSLRRLVSAGSLLAADGPAAPGAADLGCCTVSDLDGHRGVVETRKQVISTACQTRSSVPGMAKQLFEFSRSIIVTLPSR